MGNITLGAITLQGDGKCFTGEVNAKKESFLTPMPLYANDSYNTIIFDFGGVIKTITVSGVYIGTDIADCASFITIIHAFLNGKQDSSTGFPVSYVDDYHGTLKVKIQDVQDGEVSGEPLVVKWSFTLLEASTSG